MAYQPIENYGIIGDLYTVALVGMNGSIDWLCCPSFDSPSVFAAILDDKKGGHFKIAPTVGGITHKQFYWPETNVLITRFLSADGAGEITDYMPIAGAAKGTGQHQLIRRVSVVRGAMPFRMECYPAFNYARDDHQMQLTPDGACFYSQTLSLGLATRVPLKQDGKGVSAEFRLEEGQTAVFLLQDIPAGTGCGISLSEQEAMESFKNTVEYWRRWISKCTYTGRWREIVHRSALALKLLTFRPTGAIVAAPTCSLPEGVGGERNWDYRFTWLRDAAFTLYGLLRIGFTDEAAQFMQWLEARCHELNPDGSLQIMYGIDGRHTLTEEILDHLEGYKGSRPVRVGNGAYNQLQLDIYGELMDSVYLYNKYGSPISYDLWNHLRRLITWVCDNWQRKDEGIWEVRGGQQHFLYSKLMCWVAVDRALRLADKRSFPADRNRWLKVRDQIYEEIMLRGWSAKRQAFVQHYGSESLDAANLIMPLVFFISPTDPRMLKTLDATNCSPENGGLVSNSLVYRYNVKDTTDGLRGEEGTFNICTFWLVEALTRAGRHDRARLDDARFMFEKMLGHANHLGLYAEETGHSGEALGNFPQAFTHLALISAAFNLDRALGGSG
ncbi:MAG: glycoside hydrolase family 15 protein [candidate division NC10 bacterium]|nr:glycoside hydrolase family 15 protein [candidate division NC10 bacterium]